MANPLDLLFLGQSLTHNSEFETTVLWLRGQLSDLRGTSVCFGLPVFHWKAEVKGEGLPAYLPVMRLSTRVVGMQKMPTSRSLTARLRMNMLVTVRMCRFLSTVKQTRALPTMQRRKMRA